LMAWREMDVHLVREPIDRSAFFALGGRVAALLSPAHALSRRAAWRGLKSARGLDWGIQLGEVHQGGWKIDVWATGPRGLGRVQEYCDAIEKQLTESSRLAILKIKSECWRHPEYRRAFSSADIYSAVLDHRIRSVDEFWAHLRQKEIVS